MRSRTVRIVALSFLLAIVAKLAFAQDAPVITITPEAGAVEIATFNIEIDGLAPDTGYSVEIVLDGDVVFSSDETSDASGHIPYPVSSTEGDLPGIYTIQVVSDGQVIISANFELTEAEDETAEEDDFLGDVTVTPETAPFGKVQKMAIGELEPNTQYTVEITAMETLQVVYRRTLASEDEGDIEIEIFAEDGDSPGHHSIAVYDQDGEIIAEGEFTIEAPPERDVSLQLLPADVAAGSATEIFVSGLASFDSVSAQITSESGELIDTVSTRATSDGEASLSFATPDDLTAGVYEVEIFVEGDALASAQLTVSDAETELSIEPPSGPIGTEHTIAILGLAAQQSFDLIILDPAGAEDHSGAREADADGNFSMRISSTEEDTLGEYRVEVRDAENGDILASASMIIEGAADDAAEEDEPETSITQAVASIEPQSAMIGSSHLITVSGLEPGETVAFDVTFEGQSVYSADKTADTGGIASLTLVTGDEDQPGDYTITARREAGNQPSVVLTATGKPDPVFVSTLVGDAEVISGSLLGGEANISFDGASGEYVVISVSSHDFDPAAAIYDREDNQLVYVDDSRGSLSAVIGPLTLPYSGAYDLEITAAPLMMAAGADHGDFTVTIQPVNIAPINFDSAVSFTLNSDSPAHYFALPVRTGDSLTISIDSGGALDTLMQVISPAGIEYAFDDDSGPGFDAELSNLVFDHAADYVLAVSSFDANAGGDGAITISRNPVHSLDDGIAVIALNDKAIRDLVVFDGSEDELLILNLETLTGDVEDLYVTATVEGMEVMSYSTMGVPDQLPLAFVLPMSGRVVVTLEKFGFDDGISLEVSLERP